MIKILLLRAATWLVIFFVPIIVFAFDKIILESNSKGFTIEAIDATQQQILSEIQKQTGVEFKFDPALLKKDSLSIKISSSNLESGIIKLLHGYSTLITYDNSGKIRGVDIFADSQGNTNENGTTVEDMPKTNELNDKNDSISEWSQESLESSDMPEITTPSDKNFNLKNVLGPPDDNMPEITPAQKLDPQQFFGEINKAETP